MAKRRLTLIINPISGTLSKKEVSRWVPRRLESMGYEVNTVYTSGPGDATRLAAEAAARGDYGVLACGGDGTVNEVASGLIGTSTALGILPAGSGNGLARHISIPVDIERSLQVIADNHIEACDYGEVNGRPFFCTFGVGFDAAVSQRFAQKHTRGLATYLSSALDEFVKYEAQPYEIIANGEVITDRAFLVVVCNASQYGNNAFIAPSASIRDGKLDVTIVHEGNLFSHALSGLEMITGSISNHGRIRTFRAEAIKIRRATSGVTHIDGDPADMPAELDIKCCPGQLRIFTAISKPRRFRPVISPIQMMLADVGIAISRPFRKH